MRLNVTAGKKNSSKSVQDHVDLRETGYRWRGRTHEANLTSTSSGLR